MEDLYQLLEERRAKILALEKERIKGFDYAIERQLQEERAEVARIKSALREVGIEVRDIYFDFAEKISPKSDKRIHSLEKYKKAANELEEKFVIDPMSPPMLAKKYLAIVVGVSQHESIDYFGKLPFAANDAYQVATMLLSGAYGYCRDQMYLFVEREDILGLDDDLIPNGPPTWENVVSAVDECLDRADENTLIFFYFSGHGHLGRNGKEAYLVCSNTDPSSPSMLSRTSLPISDIKYGLENSQEAKVKIAILDTCHSGVLFSKRKSADSMQEEFLNEIFQYATGTVFISSCKAGQYSFPHTNAKMSAFTYFLVEGLKTMGLKKKTFVSVGMLRKYLGETFKKWAYSAKIFQTPQFQSFDDGDVIIVDYGDLLRRLGND